MRLCLVTSTGITNRRLASRTWFITPMARRTTSSVAWQQVAIRWRCIRDAFTLTACCKILCPVAASTRRRRVRSLRAMNAMRSWFRRWAIRLRSTICRSRSCGGCARWWRRKIRMNRWNLKFRCGRTASRSTTTTSRISGFRWKTTVALRWMNFSARTARYCSSALRRAIRFRAWCPLRISRNFRASVTCRWSTRISRAALRARWATWRSKGRSCVTSRGMSPCWTRPKKIAREL